MKINDSTGKLSPAAPINDRDPPVAASGAGSAARIPTEQVSLSGPARALMAGANIAPIDNGRVTEIRQKIADGSYRIAPARIADSLISAARELFTRLH